MPQSRRGWLTGGMSAFGGEAVVVRGLRRRPFLTLAV